MDPAGLTILLKEMERDCAVVRDAGQKAAARVSQPSAGHLEAAAYELGRIYGVFERLLERVCEEFENHFEKRGDYHERLLQRLALNLEGIRPPLIPACRIAALRELKGFRHVIRHAYDLTLRPDRLAELARVAEELANELPDWCRDSGAKVRAEQGWPG